MVNGQEGVLPENVAFRRTTIQSSMYGTWYSEHGVDGVRDSCTHTNTQTDPWWRVDLLKVYRVNRVAITNRLSYYSFRINGAVIRVGNFPNVYSNPICTVIPTIASGATANFSCGAMEGRYVIIHIPGDGKILTLCEVEVYRYLGANRAGNRIATQSSTFDNWLSEKAIDGNRGLYQSFTGCSSTLNETNPWWRLDMHEVYRVSEVVITNRKDCCPELINGAEIRIGNSLENNGSNNPICAIIPAIPAGESYRYSCGGMDGRYVNLIIPGDMKILTLCEVEVYGEGPVLKRSFVKMQFNSRADLTDPSIGENVLNQLGTALADRGFTNVTLRWFKTPKREVMRKVDTSMSELCSPYWFQASSIGFPATSFSWSFEPELIDYQCICLVTPCPHYLSMSAYVAKLSSMHIIMILSFNIISSHYLQQKRNHLFILCTDMPGTGLHYQPWRMESEDDSEEPELPMEGGTQEDIPHSPCSHLPVR
ncbi:uncharacterized protein [Garra rufa]|uniref:uncharacterized protein n=1 Tax=Garra rufa TaxID=137080 RepID=UPI003CCE804D